MKRSPRWVKRAVVPIANKIIYASQPYIDLKSTINSLTPDLINFSGETAGPADERLLRFVKSIRPMTAINLHLIRVGGPNDGGYVMVDDFAVSGALSLGVGSNVSWDLAIADRGIPVAMFDPTIRRLPEPVPGAAFFRLGIGSGEQPTRLLPLQHLLKIAGFASAPDLIPKMDVEGAEWASIACVTGSIMECFKQIVIEMHDLSGLLNHDDAETIFSALGVLGATHVPVHIHANNYSRLLRFDSYWFPDVIEVTYARRDTLHSISLARNLQSNLDERCGDEFTEISLEGILGLAM